MKGKQVWSWVAVAAIVAGTGLGLRERDAAMLARATPSMGAKAAEAAPVLRIADARGATIHLDAAIARRALRDGTLDVVLPDGTSYPVRIERQETHGGGHWSLVGHVSTVVGTQSMVLTFGPDAVFGQVPMPDGHAMQVETESDGRVTVAPAGGLTPQRAPLRDVAPDYQLPGRNELDTQDMRNLADRPIAIDDGLPVRIDVLALYSPELVAARGGKARALAQIAHLFAVANQAHIDSGTRVRFNLVGAEEVAIPAALSNAKALAVLSEGAYEDLRDKHHADLAAFIRPHPRDDATCGASWLSGAGGTGDALLDPALGYVVANVAPCGALVLAHELGHALGSAHDVTAQTDADGVVTFGAYEWSFDLRTPRFGTLMTDPGEGLWLARFSGTDPVGCDGAPCGEAGRIDNVRSLDAMAPAIARFRDAK